MESTSIAKTADRRQSNLELLRIFAMLLIVIHHFSVHGGFYFSTDTITLNRLWMQFIQLGGKVGVNIFVLITGYFLVSSPAIKISKAFKLWIQLFTYSVLIYLIFLAFGNEPFQIKDLLRHFFPVSYSEWWFASSYFVLYLLSPYLNKLINLLDKKTYQRMLVLLCLCWCVVPTFLFDNAFNYALQSNHLPWFVFLYILGGYIRIHAGKTRLSNMQYLTVALVFVVLTLALTTVFDVFGRKMPEIGKNATYFYDMQMLPVLLISVFMFIGFLKTDIKYSRLINLVSSATFGVYLIHDNVYVRSFLWHTVFNQAYYSDRLLLLPYSIVAPVAVFIVCTLIELFRIYVLERRYINGVNRLAAFTSSKIDRFFDLELFHKI